MANQSTNPDPVLKPVVSPDGRSVAYRAIIRDYATGNRRVETTCIRVVRGFGTRKSRA